MNRTHSSRYYTDVSMVVTLTPPNRTAPRHPLIAPAQPVHPPPPVQVASWAISDDREILQRIGAGDHDALAELYRRHAAAILGFLRRLSRDAGVAEEILQDTFLAIWKNASSFEGRAAVRTWCFGIARRQAHNRLRNLPPPSPVDPDTGWANTPAAEPGPEAASLARLSADHLRRLIDRLSPNHQEVLHLSLAQKAGTEEIADVLGIPPGTVKSRLSHARTNLRRLAIAEGVLP